MLASRILNDRGVLDAYGHVSIRHPADPSRYLMARAIAPGLVTASSAQIEPSNAAGRLQLIEAFPVAEARPGMAVRLTSAALSWRPQDRLTEVLS